MIVIYFYITIILVLDYIKSNYDSKILKLFIFLNLILKINNLMIISIMKCFNYFLRVITIT
jgi:hypothetical protein